MSESRKLFERKEVLIRSDQAESVQEDADIRYPELHGTRQLKRNFSPAMRDIIDFWKAHYPLFLSWIVSRSKTPPEATQ